MQKNIRQIEKYNWTEEKKEKREKGEETNYTGEN